MSSLNKIILIGRVGKDPETKFLSSGDQVANFSLATSEKWTSKTGEKQEETEWHNCVAFRKLAEVIGQWVRKGALIYVEGRIKTEKWTDKEGNDRYSTKVYADKMQMLGGRQEPRAEPQEPKPAKPASNFDDMDDDIPFDFGN